MDLDLELEANNQYIIASVPKLAANYLMQDYFVFVEEFGDDPVSDKLQKQLQSIRSKSLTTGVLIDFNSLVQKLNALTEYAPDSHFKSSVAQLIDHVASEPDIESCLIEHNFQSNSVMTHFSSKNPNAVMKSFTSNISFESIWGVLDSDKWNFISDYFEGIFINDEEFIQEFAYAFKLRSYAIVRDLLKELTKTAEAHHILRPNVKFIIGEHDERHFDITPRFDK